MAKCRINLKDAVDDLAPPPPPCFHNRTSWMEYLKSAAAAQNHAGEPKVIKIHKDGNHTFAFDFPMCTDCTQIKSLEMTRQGRCDPQYLANLKEVLS